MPPKLNIEPRSVVNGSAAREIRNVKFATQEGAQIVRAMIDSYSGDHAKIQAARTLLVRYEIHGKNKVLPFHIPDLNEVNNLVRKFREDPKQAMAIMRINLIEIARDMRMPEAERKERLERYLRKLIESVIMLDQYAFPPDGPGVVHQGFPSYIPDGLSDMGADAETDEDLWTREKIRVDKKKSYEVALPSLLSTIWSLANSKDSLSSTEVKRHLADSVMSSVHETMPYNSALHEKLRTGRRGMSIGIDEFSRMREPVSVCRHIAMETQLRFQLLGLESSLLKCKKNGGGHAANLLRINMQWYLVDPTNPEINPNDKGKKRVYMRPITLTDAPKQIWMLDGIKLVDGKIAQEVRVYESRTNTFYRVLDNRKNPVEV